MFNRLVMRTAERRMETRWQGAGLVRGALVWAGACVRE